MAHPRKLGGPSGSINCFLGLTYDQNLANQDALLRAFSQWAPGDGVEILAFLSSFEDGGYLLIETADPKAVALLGNQFVYWNDVKVVSVIDIEELVPVANEATAWAKAASAG